MKTWLGKFKEKLARLKPWLKQHWKAVLIALVSAGVFLFIVLKKPGLASTLANPPAAATGGAGGDTTAASPAGTTSATGGASASGHGATGGSLFDPPAPKVSRPSLPTVVPQPQTFSQLPGTGGAAGGIWGALAGAQKAWASQPAAGTGAAAGGIVGALAGAQMPGTGPGSQIGKAMKAAQKAYKPPKKVPAPQPGPHAKAVQAAATQKKLARLK